MTPEAYLNDGVDDHEEISIAIGPYGYWPFHWNTIAAVACQGKGMLEQILGKEYS